MSSVTGFEDSAIDFCCWVWEERVSAELVVAERIKELVRSAVATSALPLKIEYFNSGLPSDVYFYSSASCASPFFPMTRPLALGV